MADNVTPAVRSRMMSGIHGKDTKPELILRRGLHAIGFRYRLHVKDMPGRPDMVFPSRRAVIFAHGCFWHGHGCSLFKWPSTRPDWWRAKIEKNRANDSRSTEALTSDGWRVGVVWECALKGRSRLPLESVISDVAAWLKSDALRFEIRGFE